MTETIVILLSVLAGVFTQRTVGFGMPIIVLPVSLIFFEQTSALMITLITGLVSSILVVYQLKKKTEFDLRIIISIIPLAIIGVIAGAYVLTVISKEALQIFLGLSIILSLNIQRYFLPKPKHEIKTDQKIRLYGLLAGFFNSTVGLSAAPLLVWIRSYKVKPDQVRLLLAYSFMTMNTLSIITIQFLENNTIGGISRYVLIFLLPVIIVANYLGMLAAKKIDKHFYDQLAYLVLMFAGIITLFAGIKNHF